MSWRDPQLRNKRKEFLNSLSTDGSNKKAKTSNSGVASGSGSSTVATTPAPPAGSASKKAKGKGKAVLPEVPEWPAHFTELFKIFKALNTVIAFCSSRQQIATTFQVVRTSVERLLRKPLDLARVAEIKAIIPELIRFAYIPKADLRIHSDKTSGIPGTRERSPDIYALPEMGSSTGNSEQVLVLEFVQSVKAKMPQLGAYTPHTAPALSPAEVKKLIEKRNDRFMQAVNELLLACNLTDPPEDPVALVTKAAIEHIPVDPFLAREHASRGPPLEDTSQRASIDDILAELEKGEEYKDQICHRRIFDPKEARYGELDEPLSKTVAKCLKDSMNVTSFYEHQAKAINALRNGKHVIVSTGTASGKSVIYQVPLVSYLEADRDTTAMFIFPTKALAQDQKATLEHLLCRCPGLEDIKIATYDGDTPTAERPGIRDSSSVIFTNFDMIHIAILPHEDAWRRFLKNLKVIVVDELHYYSGTMGSHVAFVMRRLRRVCAAVGNRRVKFVSCSATISNPAAHMTSIFGVEEMEVVTEDGSPSGRKDFVIWNPPQIDPMKGNSARISSITEGCALFKALVTRGVKTILFCKIRKTCELAMKTIRAQLAAEGRNDLLGRIRSYRGGYSQEDRRQIERQAFSGKLIGIIATNALELGINIGSLDAVIMLGFPFSVASLRQQSGRAGRRLQDSLAVLVPDHLPIDQHFVNNPDDIYDKPMADLVIDLENDVILEAHLQCAAHEMPISTTDDADYFGRRSLFESMCEKRLVKDKEGWYHTHPKFKPRPSTHVAIRGTQEVKYLILDITNTDNGAPEDGRYKILEEIEISRAVFETYEGGIFMHQGLTFLVKEVSHDDRTAKVIQTDVNWLTTVRDFTDIDPEQTHRIRAIRGSPHRAYFGRVDIKIVIFGFFKIRNGSILDVVDLETPPFIRHTVGMWVDVPKEALDLFRRKGLNPAEGIHSAQHLVLNMSPLFAFANDGDIKTECKIAEKEYAATPTQRKRPARLMFYDDAGKSSGVAAKAFDHSSDLLQQALERLENCSCEEGCPSCIEGANCRSGNLVFSKLGAQLILQSILNLPIDEDAIPDADPETTVDAGHETIVEARVVRADVGISLEGVEDPV